MSSQPAVPQIRLVDVQHLSAPYIFFSIGTSGIVEPAASLAYRALSRGATVVLINLDVVNDASRQLYKINAPAGQVLPALVEVAWPTAATT